MNKQRFFLSILLFFVCGSCSLHAQLLFEKPPKNFNPKIEATVCFISANNKFLFLKRHPLKPQGNTWGIPGGKLLVGEDPASGVLREISEETGLHLQKQSLKHLKTAYIRSFYGDFILHIFEYALGHIPKAITINDEHTEYRWLSLREAKQLSLMPGGEECINLVYGSDR
jgi:8-oxo-dGTP pyrophosphatase MutT (NUDIX family)